MLGAEKSGGSGGGKEEKEISGIRKKIRKPEISLRKRNYRRIKCRGKPSTIMGESSA